MSIFEGGLAAFLSLALSAGIVVALYRHGDAFIAAERWGLSIGSTASFLSIPHQLGLDRLMLPWQGFYQLLWRVGWCLFVYAMLVRLERHGIKNLAGVRAAREYLKGRGKA